MPLGAFHEGDAQILNQWSVVTDSSGKSRVQSAWIIGHGVERYLACVKFW